MRVGYSQRGGWYWSGGCLFWLVVAVIILGAIGWAGSHL